MKKIIVIGSGGHASSVIDTINEYSRLKYKFCGCIDKFKPLSKDIVANDIDEFTSNKFKDHYFIIAIGNNKIRNEWYEKILKYNLKLINIIDKTAIISNSLKIGNGNFIGKNVVITSNVEIGNNCIVNTGAIIEHGSKIKNSINISPSSLICGDVFINDLSWICANSTVLGQIRIGKNVIIGANSLVRKNVNDNEIWVGMPAKFLKNNL